ncbi:hypothetical protein RRG08_014796 [Elysia crispata]|uniref:Uncharacterized protein n=1 Tax=Elysia crispata TaxID=231223 RepID=A0AAE1E5A0_9GAST|nr:hypothetical protein RRG08_014796 [Elysia crispata]
MFPSDVCVYHLCVCTYHERCVWSTTLRVGTKSTSYAERHNGYDYDDDVDAPAWIQTDDAPIHSRGVYCVPKVGKLSNVVQLFNDKRFWSQRQTLSGGL